MALDLEEESKFAKIVSTPNGPAILIMGYVIDVVVPAGLQKEEVVDVLTRALRRQVYDNSLSVQAAAQVGGTLS